MKYYLIAGEASGDLHASNLMKEIRGLDKQADFRFWGGELMEKEGGTLVRHYKDAAFMGFLEVLLNIRKITGNLAFCKKDILEFRPDVLILVDYPGFNLRIARFARKAGIRVFYYISPQLWAWNSSRVKVIKQTVERMFVILPFEKEFYAGFDYKVDFVGHPLLDVIKEGMHYTPRETFFQDTNLISKPIVALLPGSRKQEIASMLPVMLKSAAFFPGHQAVIAAVSAIPDEFYHKAGNDSVHLVRDQTYDLLKHSDAALVTSGTATLETALVGTPQIVCYRGNFLSYLIARMVVKVRYISLVNLIMNRQVIPELIQRDLKVQILAGELGKILPGGSGRQNMISEYRLLREKLGREGASANTAALVIQYLNEKKVS